MNHRRNDDTPFPNLMRKIGIVPRHLLSETERRALAWAQEEQNRENNRQHYHRKKASCREAAE